MTGHRRCAPCAVPPHILERIARNGNDEQRARALSTMAQDSSHRSVRVHNALMRSVQRPATPPRLAPTSGPRRTIGDAKESEDLPGTTVRAEGDAPVADVAVNEAYDGLGATFAFFLDAYGRDSVDDDGMGLLATVHYGDHYENAFWNGRQMVFGDGDGELFNRFTVSLDIIGHELAHGVTEDEAQLMYLNQSGALNESLSDVFGSLVKQHLRGQTAEEADWLIGEGLLTDAVQGVALRSMKEPGTAYDDPVLGDDIQPAHMDGYVRTTTDNGGVHINSGIPNKAFHTLAVALGGHAWERAGRIWYEALRAPQLRPNATFRSFAAATSRQAQVLFGPEETQAVRDAWASVGVPV
ncbi:MULTISPECIES: M4 family metallopeptidase [unclassified Parafrankia]|uniref:M4 family metallopeptidase n=1 Tax=unclassified Parafrankia TaxID=2994368 RepID=UPI000DA49798|nr:MULTISPECIES: M4 family metallopeptidase [unclassified Parafrankia]TCJ36507.1 peptidase M4 family protein [Parafrankia sp. BMG5.11]CAI7979295.1 Extracellular metalloprotease [Frankia sp. Hr75.2]SQD97642.1 Extracellular metalloprotease [Parafrankia sp. Ea1.12]